MRIQTTHEIDAPAAAVWDLLGEKFADVSEWADSIVKSSIDRPLGKGAVRTCDLKAFGPVPAGQITEELTVFNRDDRALTFVVHTGLPGFMRFVENAWSVESIDGNHSRVMSRATFRLAWWMVPLSPLLRFQLGRGLRGFVVNLASTVKARVKVS